MARIINWPRNVGKVSYQRLTGPRTAGAASSESLGGFVQTVSSVFGAWRYQIGVVPMHKRLFRLYRGMVTALHGGANAVRVPFDDPDVMSFREAGIVGIPDHVTHPESPWSNGQPWSNGKNWGISRPAVALAEDAVEGDSIIVLSDTHWGHELIGGEWLGFFPFCLGKYEVTQVLGGGEYLIWPPLRAAVTAGASFARIDRIVMAMRLEAEAAGTVQRGVAVAEGNTLTLVEVSDTDVRQYFAD